MREVLPELLKWWRDGQTIGVGTVVATFEELSELVSRA